MQLAIEDVICCRYSLLLSTICCGSLHSCVMSWPPFIRHSCVHKWIIVSGHGPSFPVPGELPNRTYHRDTPDLADDEDQPNGDGTLKFSSLTKSPHATKYSSQHKIRHPQEFVDEWKWKCTSCRFCMGVVVLFNVRSARTKAHSAIRRFCLDRCNGWQLCLRIRVFNIARILFGVEQWEIER